MAKTAVTNISAYMILLNPGSVDAIKVTGTLYEAMAPGTWVAFDSTNMYWVKLTSATASHNYRRVGVVNYVQRRNTTTQALLGITDNVDPTNAWDYTAEIIVSGFVVAKITDQNATLDIGQNVVASATAGSCTGQALTTGYLTNQPIGTVAQTVVNDDTWGVFAIGKCMGLPYAAQQ